MSNVRGGGERSLGGHRSRNASGREHVPVGLCSHLKHSRGTDAD